MTDFYSVTTDTGPSRAVEEWLRNVETEAQRVLAGGGLLDPNLSLEGRANLALFVALQYLRTPAAREMFDRLAWESIRDFFQQNFAKATSIHLTRFFEEVYRRAPENDEIERFRQSGLVLGQVTAPSPSANNHTRVMAEKAQVVAQVLIERPWRVFMWHEHSLLTNDNPVILYSSSQGFGAGFLNADHILFPVDSRTCLSIDTFRFGKPGALHYSLGDDEAARFIKDAVAATCRDWIFAHPSHKNPLGGVSISR